MITFANPGLLLLLLLLPVLAGVWIWGDRRGRRQVEALVAVRLSGGLVKGRRPVLAALLFLMELAALACFFVALARPRYGYIERELAGEGRTLMFAIDTSRSMLAEDLAPNRLQRALLAARELVLALPGDRIGVIAFAGRAFVQAPLTIDHAAVLETLEQLDAGIIPRGGTNVSEAIERAIETFDKAESANHALIIFTDGDELEGDALAMARKAGEKDIMIITIGVGTRAGSVIPARAGSGSKGMGYLVDSAGEVVNTRLDGERLEQLARATQGLYLRLDSSDVAGALVRKALENLEKVSVKSERMRREPVERYRWPLMAGIVMYLGAWAGMLGMVRWRRRGDEPVIEGNSVRVPAVLPWVGLAVLGVAGVTDVAEAGLQPGRDPYAAVAEGRHRDAIALLTGRLERAPQSRLALEWRFTRGTAAFREGDFELAIEDFSATLLSDDRRMQEQSHYNLGNAIAGKARLRVEAGEGNRGGEPELLVRDLEDAIGHFVSALELNPDNGDAAVNRDALEEFIEQLQRQAQAEAQEGEQEQAGNEGDAEDAERGEGESSGEGGQPGEGESASSSGAGDGDGESSAGGEQREEGETRGSEASGEEDPRASGGEGGAERPPEPEEGDGADEREGERDGGETEGELKALRPDGEGGREPAQDRAGGGAGGDKKDPRTGFSPSEARQLLRALTDEDRMVRPVAGEAIPEGDYKDW